jgi:hypothetical protein
MVSGNQANKGNTMPNQSSPHGGFISEGTVSHGTLRTQDLLRSFADELNRVLPFNGSVRAEEAREYAIILDSITVTDTDIEAAQYALEDMFDQLNTIANREGFYFGAHPGDGSDFGYWALETAEED